ncbi:SDR family NAD(P)-dependent oxidoreductase [Paenibacillus sp. PL91]|uniref:SDR family NAD(P)-dependent oxidoreductase n=1 Tax=Paenibacillus sp. PL91 TaxID=2729538 RepID=UPI00145D2C6C|nr:SDR family NAD(P)-dependent oxidoreductase [Paenibacillus sp. PL91]MBC9202202.1 SDR family NAD(P)-dependent oxidoreductase [Paenibacillus sp. PL91]
MNTAGHGRTALITGASNGIGLELTRKMLAEGWQIIALNRSAFPEDDKLIRESVSKNQLRIYKADLAHFDSLRHALNQIKAAEERVDLLFNNAGGSLAELSFSKQKRELHFELHTVVPYIILMELKELLQRGTLKTVVNTSSYAFKFRKKFDPDELEHPTDFTMLYGSYAASKLALSLWSQEIAAVLADDGIKIFSVDPGGNNTIRKGKKSGIPFYLKPMIKLFFPHPRKGASLLYEAAMDVKREKSGVFFVNGQVTELKFIKHARKMLEKVSFIYRSEYAGDAKV